MLNKQEKLGFAIFWSAILLVIGLVLLNYSKKLENSSQVPLTPDIPKSQNVYESSFDRAIFTFGITVVPIEVVEDSRCPEDVQCIQAGTVRINVRIGDEIETTEKIITLGEKEVFGDISVRLIDVKPYPNSKKTIERDDYVFTFEIKGKTNPSIDGLPESSKVPNAPTNFAKIGVVTLNNAGQEKDVPYIVFEERGAPALNKKLVFDEESTCAAPNGSADCMAISVGVGRSYQGKRVTVEGLDMTSYVLVRLMRSYNEGDEIFPPKTGDIILSWKSGVKLIRTCAVASVGQTHAREVSISLKDGRRVRTVEPMIDDLFEVVDKSVADCGMIPMATE